MEGRPLLEREWIEAARRGDASAFEELVRQYQEIAFRTSTIGSRTLGAAEACVVHTRPMRQQRLLLGSLLIVTLAGCSLAEPAWPDAYREAVCAATQHLRAAEAQLVAAVAAVEAADPDLLQIAAAGLGRKSRDAGAALVGAPAWGPGSRLLAELNAAADALVRAAAGFLTGARQGLGPALDRAVAAAQDGDAALRRAEVEDDRLRDTLGWQPC